MNILKMGIVGIRLFPLRVITMGVALLGTFLLGAPAGAGHDSNRPPPAWRRRYLPCRALARAALWSLAWHIKLTGPGCAEEVM